MVSLSSIDLGQGMKSVTRQIASETLGVPVSDVYVDTADSDTGPHCMGSFASRGTHRVGNAVIRAATEARKAMLEAAAEELEVNAADLDTDGQGNIHVKGAAGPCDHGRRNGDRRPVQTGPHAVRTRNFPDPAIRGRPGHGRDDPGFLFCPCCIGCRSGRSTTKPARSP